MISLGYWIPLDAAAAATGKLLNEDHFPFGRHPRVVPMPLPLRNSFSFSFYYTLLHLLYAIQLQQQQQ
jgi:hypothetical protein